MEIRDPKAKPVAGLDWATGGYSTMAKSLQVLAEDITKISAASYERNAKLIDDLRGARTVEDIVAIQTKFMAGMFETFNEHVRLMGARMSDLRTGMSQATRDVMESNVEAAQTAFGAAAQAGKAAMTPPSASKASFDQAVQKSTELAQANLKAGQDMGQSGLDAALKAADSIRNAARAALSPQATEKDRGANES